MFYLVSEYKDLFLLIYHISPKLLTNCFTLTYFHINTFSVSPVSLVQGVF